ncbi:MAG: flagellar basal body-associated FliL family protein [Nitrospiraceae bacterium]|nr:flagellar basal body-associated FliL family protein [Nitrospiraceae bacterium]
MADEKPEEGKAEKPKDAGKRGSKKLIIIIAVAAIVLGAGGFLGYRMFFGHSKGKDGHGSNPEVKSALVAIDPFVVNLTEHGRYLKVTMQFELADSANQPLVLEKMPNLRDTIITLLSSKSADAVSGPEGKLQLKDELLLRANQAVGKDVFRNLFFTEFVMQ